MQYSDVAPRLDDIAKQAYKRGVAYSSFITIEAVSYALSIAKQYGLQVKSYGGYEESERSIVCFYEQGQEIYFPIKCLLLKSREDITHSQVLGSVLGLGIKRDTIGDIIIDGNAAYVFCLSHIADFISDNLMYVGKTHVDVESLMELPDIVKASGQEKRIVASSLRLDVILSSALNLSRSSATALINQARVFRNHIQENKVDRRLEENDIISIRGIGRLKLLSIADTNKKGKFPIYIETYLNNRRRK